VQAEALATGVVVAGVVVVVLGDVEVGGELDGVVAGAGVVFAWGVGLDELPHALSATAQTKMSATRVLT
jgi:hypothetical protein